ncbi:MAG: ABC transporter permease [Gemmataceae bacterium]
MSVTVDDATRALPTPDRTPTPSPVLPLNSALPELPLTVIESRQGVSFADFRELARYRELLYYLILREMKLRYKQTILGVGWSLFQPLSIMVMFVLFVGRAGGMAANPEVIERYSSYTLFVLAGALPWTFFATAALNAGHSLLINERLVTKIYFPRLMLPLANIGSAFIDFMIASVLLIGAMVYYQQAPGWTVLLLPFILLVMMATAAGIGTLLAALIVSQRDFRYLLLFGVQLWMLATPCIYDPTAIQNPLVAINPAYGLILNFRAALFGEPLHWAALGLSSAVGLTVLAIGLMYFRKVERTFADTI